VTTTKPIRRSDGGAFLREWLSDPLRVAAIVPSGRALAEMMTRDLDAASAPVIELGPGTGAFTDALLKRGIPEDRLALIETGSNFVNLLRLRLPRATVLAIDATQLRKVILFDGEPAGAVVSGLPVLAMPPRAVMLIVYGAFVHLRPGGAMYQFTYGPVCPVKRQILDRLGLESKRIGGTMINLPPASVYRITRIADRA